MVNFVEMLFGVAIGATLIAVLAFIQSKSGPERAVKYTMRMKSALTVAGAFLLLAIIGEIYLRNR
jgi:hypothetical protein